MKKKLHPLGLIVLLLYAAVMLAPIAWLIITSFKHASDVVAVPPRGLPTMDSTAPPAARWVRVSLDGYRQIFSGSDSPVPYLFNSILIAAVSTIASVFLGAFAAYGFSRFRLAGEKDWLFFILSTRLLPPLAVAVPISWMYYKLGLNDTRLCR